MTITIRPRWSLGRGKTLVPSRWQATPDHSCSTSCRGSRRGPARRLPRQVLFRRRQRQAAPWSRRRPRPGSLPASSPGPPPRRRSRQARPARRPCQDRVAAVGLASPTVDPMARSLPKLLFYWRLDARSPSPGLEVNHVPEWKRAGPRGIAHLVKVHLDDRLEEQVVPAASTDSPTLPLAGSPHGWALRRARALLRSCSERGSSRPAPATPPQPSTQPGSTWPASQLTPDRQSVQHTSRGWTPEPPGRSYGRRLRARMGLSERRPDEPHASQAGPGHDRDARSRRSAGDRHIRRRGVARSIG
jgi:hypothetical protein